MFKRIASLKEEVEDLLTMRGQTTIRVLDTDQFTTELMTRAMEGEVKAEVEREEIWDQLLLSETFIQEQGNWRSRKVVLKEESLNHLWLTEALEDQEETIQDLLRELGKELSQITEQCLTTIIFIIKCMMTIKATTREVVQEILIWDLNSNQLRRMREPLKREKALREALLLWKFRESLKLDNLIATKLLLWEIPSNLQLQLLRSRVKLLLIKHFRRNSSTSYSQYFRCSESRGSYRWWFHDEAKEGWELF